jgi:hypothetical protein
MKGNCSVAMKKPCSPHSNFQFPPPLFSFVSLLLLSLFFSGCAGRFDNSLWHQHYQPIESLQALSFAQEAFSEAQQQYGNSEYAVRNIHIRQSIGKKDILLFSRTDIVDFNDLSRRIFLSKEYFPEKSIWTSLDEKTRQYVEQLASGNVLSVEGQQKIVEGLNVLIVSENFYHELISCKYTESKEQHSGTRKKDIAGRKKYLRNFLTSHFSGLLLPMPGKKPVLEGVEVCECLEPNKDVCILYVSTAPGDPLFFPQLAHEVLHLLSPDCYDWYVEGLSNLFSEDFCKMVGHPWQPVLNSFYAKEKTDPYAISYFMMRDINNVAGSYLRNFLNFTVWSDAGKTRKHVDVDGWLRTLPPKTSRLVIDIIHLYAPSLTAHKGLHNSFYLP